MVVDCTCFRQASGHKDFMGTTLSVECVAGRCVRDKWLTGFYGSSSLNLPKKLCLRLTRSFDTIIIKFVALCPVKKEKVGCSFFTNVLKTVPNVIPSNEFSTFRSQRHNTKQSQMFHHMMFN